MSADLRSAAARVREYLRQRAVTLADTAVHLVSMRLERGPSPLLHIAQNEMMLVTTLTTELLRAAENDANHDSKLEEWAIQYEERADDLRRELNRLIEAFHKGTHVEAAVVAAEKFLEGKP